jgi:hypothetical protein
MLCFLGVMSGILAQGLGALLLNLLVRHLVSLMMGYRLRIRAKTL